MDFIDQVPRRLAFEQGHPNVEIHYGGPYWQAVIHEEIGDTIITRYTLKALLDKLEQLSYP